MAGKKQPTHQVVKRGVYFSPKEGELEIGTQLTLTTTQAEKLEKRGMVKALKDVKTVDATGADADAFEATKKELAAANAALSDKDKELAAANAALTKAAGA